MQGWPCATVARHWTWPFALALVLSVAVWFPILYLVPELFTYYEMDGQAGAALATPVPTPLFSSLT